MQKIVLMDTIDTHRIHCPEMALRYRMFESISRRWFWGTECLSPFLGDGWGTECLSPFTRDGAKVQNVWIHFQEMALRYKMFESISGRWRWGTECLNPFPGDGSEVQNIWVHFRERALRYRMFESISQRWGWGTECLNPFPGDGSEVQNIWVHFREMAEVQNVLIHFQEMALRSRMFESISGRWLWGTECLNPFPGDCSAVQNI